MALTATMRVRLEEIAKQPDGVHRFEQPNWGHATDKALARRGLVRIERAMSWWRVAITAEGRSALATTPTPSGEPGKETT